MRILLLSDWMSNRGGAESYIVSLRDGLRKSGDEVELISCGASPSVSDQISLHVPGSDGFLSKAFLQLSNPFADAKVRSTVRAFRPDVALVSQFAYHLSPSVIGALDPVPTIVSIMDYKVICPLGTKLLPDGTACSVRAGSVCRKNGCVGTIHWLRDQPRYARIARALKSVRRILCSSETMRNALALDGIEAACVPLAATRRESIAHQVPADKPTFAYCGRLSREKGVAVLIAAFAKIIGEFPDATLRIIGDGSLRSDLERLASALGVFDSIEFRGWVAPENMDAETGDAWAIVAPSLWAEPFGLVAIEAIMRSIPIVASDSGGFRESVEDGVSGMLFPAGSVAALADTLRAVAGGRAFPGHRLDDAVVGKTVDEYGFNRHLSQIKAVFSEVGASAPVSR